MTRVRAVRLAKEDCRLTQPFLCRVPTNLLSPSLFQSFSQLVVPLAVDSVLPLSSSSAHSSHLYSRLKHFAAFCPWKFRLFPAHPHIAAVTAHLEQLDWLVFCWLFLLLSFRQFSQGQSRTFHDDADDSSRQNMDLRSLTAFIESSPLLENRDCDRENGSSVAVFRKWQLQSWNDNWLNTQPETIIRAVDDALDRALHAHVSTLFFFQRYDVLIRLYTTMTTRLVNRSNEQL